MFLTNTYIIINVISISSLFDSILIIESVIVTNNDFVEIGRNSILLRRTHMAIYVYEEYY